MSDTHAAPKGGGSSGGGRIVKNIKFLLYVVFIFIILIFIYQTIYNTTNIELLLTFLYGLEIFLSAVCIFLIFRFWKFTKDFHHLCHEIDHIFEHKNHPHHKEHIPYDQIIQKKLDDISEIFKEHDSTLWPANFKSLNLLLTEEMKSKNIIGNDVEEMFKDLLTKGFSKRKELDLLLRVKNKVQASFFNNQTLEVAQLNKVAELYEYVIKEIVNFGGSAEH